MTNSQERKEDKKRSIGNVAKALSIPTHTIRYWETRFPQIKPTLGNGGRRYYYGKQFQLIKAIKKSLYEDGYTIEGLQKILRKSAKKEVQQMSFEDLLNSAKEASNLDDEQISKINQHIKNIEKNLNNYKNLLDEIL